MAPLDKLFALEVEFHRKLRCDAHGTGDANALHTSYALQCGYEPLLRSVGRVAAQEIGQLSEKFALVGDTRDILAARDALLTLFDLRP